jgi:hypothetical protein
MSSSAAFAMPAAAVAMLHLLMLVAAAFDLHPFWRTHPLNLSEAAALHDAGEVVRLIEQGQNPDAPQPVRAGVIDSTARVLTPFEAAVAEDRPEIIALLLRTGAALDTATWTRLYCFAAREPARDTQAFLETVRPAAAAKVCEGVATPGLER